MRYVLCLLIGIGWAQQSPPKGISRKAYDLYLQAIRLVQMRQEERALLLLQEVLSLEPRYEEALILMGKIQIAQKDYSNAKTTGRSLMNLPSATPTAVAWGLYFLGKGYMAEMAYDSAASLWQRFIFAAKGQLPRSLQEEGARLLSQSKSAAELMRHPVPFAPRNLGPSVNSASEEYLPSLTADGRRLFFTSRRPKLGHRPNPLSGPDEDLYWSEKSPDTEEWLPAQLMPPPITSSQNEGAAFFSADGQWVFITMCDRPDGYGSCDLYFSELKGLSWSDPKNLGSEVNSPFWESHPSLTHDRKRLYFASGRPGGMGGSDIWYTEWKEGKWQKAVNLGPPINTPGDEYSPTIAADGRTLYFASDYHPGMGGQDLFITYLTDTGWTQPRNLGYPLNTPQDEQTLCVDARGLIAYIALNRSEGFGKEDIYEFRMWPEIRPQQRATYVRGKVVDSQSQAPLVAFVAVVDVETQDTIRSLHSNEATGEFLISLPLGRRYGLFARRSGYLFYSGHFDLAQGDTAYELLIPLQKLQKGSRLVLRNIFFDFDKAELKPESEVELQEVLYLLRENPHWKIEIEGHTDSIGLPTYNQNLSQRRAEAVRRYLIDHGIPPTRISARGYGATRPIADNRTEEGRALNRRTELLFLANE
ncbi:MAG: OmpA family protein [Bacteroidia bacterium]|nr:OmpA family protein [Bacteroidia bacterium]MDW8015495.1 OmpA family protein [Bacteroidia bacterium]